uniref:Zinc finger CCCH domain-containing protein 25-like n=1 Tax=Ananas comosus var. bracteatus TaxID=296719 RepID=A0A6V7QVV0_ANACO
MRVRGEAGPDAEDQFEGGGFRISDEASWHAEYKDSAYIFVGGIPFDLTEGDLLAVFAQYGEIVDVNLVRDKSTGKSKGFAFLAYEDQRSTILAVDNLNGAKILGRIVRVDHVSNYKKKEEEDEEKEQQRREARGVCRAYQRGDCHRGASCKFSHDEQRCANTGWGPKDNARWDHDIYDLPKGNKKPLHNALEQKQQHRGEKQDSPSRSANKDDRPLRSEAKWVRETIAERPRHERKSRYDAEHSERRKLERDQEDDLLKHGYAKRSTCDGDSTSRYHKMEDDEHQRRRTER